MSVSPPNIFLCNSSNEPENIPDEAKVFTLSYLPNSPNRNINLQLPRFVDSLYHLPDRILDLLEIAAYVFAADRSTSRGPNEAVEFHTWQRSMRFEIRVRDDTFWNRPKIKEKLSNALAFMTGDREYIFEFSPGHVTAPTSFFDREEFKIEISGPVSVVLFSGGLDSLAGVLERLHSTNDAICLISHRSGRPSIKRTQNQLVEALKHLFPERIYHFSFDCGLSHEKAIEETQRTRAFLFGSIAFALAYRLSQDRFFAYENGITSLNLIRRQDLINARASRTTHPKTQALMSSFFSEFQEKEIKVINPFWQYTKTDVFLSIDRNGGRNLINSTVSCSKIYQRLGSATHCGCCFQCIDRRIASYASGLQEVDNSGIYSRDIIVQPIEYPETRTTALDYIRQATTFAKSTDDEFYREHLSELIDISDFIDAHDEQDAVNKIFQLCNRHGKQVVDAIYKIRRQHDDPRYEVQSGCLLQLLANREYLKDSTKRLSENISKLLVKAVPIAFKSRRPTNEDDLNNQIDALLNATRNDFRREFPITTFSLAKVVPDHESNDFDLLIEAKYIRKGTPPSKACEGIAADITKYPPNKFILFVIYDPDRGISNDAEFKSDIEKKRECLVSIIR